MQDTSSHHDAHDGTFIPLTDTVILDAAVGAANAICC